METWRCDIYPYDGPDHHGVGNNEAEAILNAALAYRGYTAERKEND